MAYLGSTQLSSIANPPRCITQLPAPGARVASTACPMAANIWFYGSTDTSTSLFTANYISDAYYLGMKQGDVVIYVGMTSTASSSQVLGFGIVGAVTTAGTQLSTWSFMSST